MATKKAKTVKPVKTPPVGPLMTVADRKVAALKIALKLARKVGAKRVTLAQLAAEMKVTPPLMFHVFGNRESLVKEIVKAAKAQGVTLPESAPTVREQRAKAKPAVKAIAKPKAAPVVKKPAAKKVAAILKPPVKVKPSPKVVAKNVAPVTPKTPAAKFAALPKPFEAAIKQVQAAA